MASARRGWTVTPHEPIQKLEDNLWTVQGLVPGARFPRRMCVVRRLDGTLLFFHAIPLDEPSLSEVMAWGTPEDLVVGHHQHAMDAAPFAKRLGLRVYGPAAVATRLSERVDLSGHLENVKTDASVEVRSVPGSKLGETMVIVRSGEARRVSLLFSDVIQNGDRDRLPLIFRMLGFAGGPKVVPAYRMLFVGDRGAIKAALSGWSELAGLERIVPCHGEIVSVGAAPSLARAAAAL
jgi:hypothetical protein